MARPDLDEYSAEPLTPLETKKMRRLLEADDRAQWFWASTRIWLGAAAGVVVTVITIASGGADLLKKLFLLK